MDTMANWYVHTAASNRSVGIESCVYTNQRPKVSATTMMPITKANSRLRLCLK